MLSCARKYNLRITEAHALANAQEDSSTVSVSGSSSHDPASVMSFPCIAGVPCL